MTQTTVIVIAPLSIVGQTEQIWFKLWEFYIQTIQNTESSPIRIFFLSSGAFKEGEPGLGGIRKYRGGHVGDVQIDVDGHTEKAIALYTRINDEKHFLWIREETNGAADTNYNRVAAAITWLENSFSGQELRFYIAYHDRSGLKDKSRQLQSDFNLLDKPVEFIHEKSDPIYPTLKQMVQTYVTTKGNGTTLNLAEIFDQLCRKIALHYAIPSFSDLKHSIAHLFLAMDVDLQEIEVRDKGDAIDYLRNVLKRRMTTYYRQKLADLQFRVAKVTKGEEKPLLECDGKASCRPARPTLSESNLPDGKTIVDLISEEKRSPHSVILLWITLIALSGLKLEHSNRPFENVNPDTDSRIFKLMCLMDCKIDKKNNLGEKDVHDVTDFFAEGWTVDGVSPPTIKCFNDWFCALDDCIDKLRNMIRPD